jgi:tRNA (cytidine/uridine-2'-O-)-methyltransferase
MFNIVLVSPKIPQNTGTIGRTCVSLGAKLHLIKPFPFDLDEKKVRRAGLDYWEDLDLTVWESLEEFLKANPINNRHFFATTKTKKEYFNIEYKENDFIYFGSEDSGLPKELFKTDGVMINIPMKSKYRSLNQSNAVSIIVYEALRQNYNLFDL